MVKTPWLEPMGQGFVDVIFDYGDEKEQRGHDLMRRAYDSVGSESTVMQCDPDAQAMSHNKGWSLPQLGAGHTVYEEDVEGEV